MQRIESHGLTRNGRLAGWSAWQIELFFERGNKIIRRNIFRDNRSTWMLNGRDATLKHIMSVMESAKIQIDNLCQFLPQDKVGEFSRMNPVQVSREAQLFARNGFIDSAVGDAFCSYSKPPRAPF